jgi:hypothetical protein
MAEKPKEAAQIAKSYVPARAFAKREQAFAEAKSLDVLTPRQLKLWKDLTD